MTRIPPEPEPARRILRVWTIYVCAGCGRHEADRCDSSCSEWQRGQEQRWEKVEVMEIQK